MHAGLTTKLAASLMEWSEPKLWRIETGQTAMRAHDVQAMCAAYDAPTDLTPALAALARQTRAHGWWRAYGEDIPDDFGIYAALEDSARTLTGYTPCLVPGLLCTEPYARALLPSTSSETDRLVYDCLDRRLLVTRASAPLAVTLALDEALLRRPKCRPPARRMVHRRLVLGHRIGRAGPGAARPRHRARAVPGHRHPP
jgi:hypothetical protein